MRRPDAAPTPAHTARGQARERLAALSERVDALETAHRAGTLAAALAATPPFNALPPSPDLAAVYGRLLAPDAPPPDPRRADALRTLLARAGRGLIAPLVSFHARRLPATPDLPHGALAVRAGRRELRLRWDQVESATAWGIGFELDRAQDGLALARGLEARIARRLVALLGSLERVQRRLLERGGGEDLPFATPDAGWEFEQLLLDLLNEERRQARRAPLYEDLFEKTDLRLSPPGLVRRRGARVQVQRAVAAAYHDPKAAAIRRGEEWIVLSPLALARSFDGDAAAHLNEREREELGALFAGARGEEGRAAALRAHWIAALGRRAADPRGPMAAVLPALRRWVRAWAEARAHASTAHLRARLAPQEQGDETEAAE